jgi:hypothetical protein
MTGNQSNFNELPNLAARLLPNFIHSKLQHYLEPTKKGTPKGEAVGFSLTKYQATLFALRDNVLDAEDLKAQAEELGISYGVLRKWRSEQKFKDQVAKHEEEFVALLLDNVQYNAYALFDGLEEERASMLLEALRSKTMQKESARKLKTLIYEKMQDQLRLPGASRRDLRKYQIAALDQAIELLEDRPSAIKHRKDVISLLMGIKKTLA